MHFRDWIKLDEIQHVSLPRPMKINGVYADGIDFRFEDWKRGYNPEKRRGVVAISTSGDRFFNGSFSAPMEGGWVNVNQPKQGATMGNVGLKLGTQTQVQLGTAPLFPALPKNWFDFSIMYLGNDVVKAPEWPRSELEKRPKTVAEVEPV